MAKRTCSIEDCQESHYAKNFCRKHYVRWRTHGDPYTVRPAKPPAPKRPCSVDECGKPHQALGWCRDHYQKWRLYGDPLAERPPNGREKQSCAVDGCQRPVRHRSRGLCSTHEWRLDNHGDVTWRPPLPGEPKQCTRCGVTKPTDEFTKHPSGIGGVSATCKACKKQYDAEYREKNRAKRRESHARRKAVVKGADAEYIDMDILWESSDGICALCNQSVDPTLTYPNPMSWSLDHVKPISLGGRHRLDNVRITHLTCNVKRGAARGESS